MSAKARDDALFVRFSDALQRQLSVYALLFAASAAVGLARGLGRRDADGTTEAVDTAFHALILGCIAYTTKVAASDAASASAAAYSSSSSSFTFGYLRLELLAAFVVCLLTSYHGVWHLFEGVERALTWRRHASDGAHAHSASFSVLELLRLGAGAYGVLAFLPKRARAQERHAMRSRTRTPDLHAAVFLHASASGAFAVFGLLLALPALHGRFRGVYEAIGHAALGGWTVRVLWPLSRRIAYILLQTTPRHLRSGLQAAVRSVSDIQGVLRVQDAHFWALTAGCYIGSITVRVRDDADVDRVRRAVHERLGGLLTELTVMVERNTADARQARERRTGAQVVLRVCDARGSCHGHHHGDASRGGSHTHHHHHHHDDVAVKPT